KSMASITDGTSTTIAMSEKVFHRLADGSNISANKVDIRAAIVQNVGSIMSNPSSCYAQTQGNFYTGVTIKAKWGNLWTDGQAERVGFNTILPPNGPSCANDNNLNADATGDVLPPSSNHPNGVMGLMCDGSVKFITN